MTGLRWSEHAAAAVAPIMPEGSGDSDRVARAYACAAWSCLTEPGDGVAGALIQALGPDVALREVLRGTPHPDVAGAAEVSSGELHAALARWRPRMSADAVAFALEVARAGRLRLLTPDDDAWPTGAADLGPNAPVCLWVRGDPAVLGRLRPAIAIVGARAATGYGEHIAGEFAAELSARGIAVISGAAYGIDGAAHRGALASGGTTVALLAGGVDRPYPSGHTDLIARIAAAGAVAGETPPGSAPTKWRFLQRNRLIAALSDATVVVEAGRRSGSLNTAGHAATLGRPLGAVPGPVTSGSSAGCHRLLREFDARCVTCVDEAAELLGLGLLPVEPVAGDGTGDRTRIIDALSSRSPRDVDDVARRSGIAPERVRSHLGLLQLEGVAEPDGTGWRRAASRRAR